MPCLTKARFPHLENESLDEMIKLRGESRVEQVQAAVIILALTSSSEGGGRRNGILLHQLLVWGLGQ